MDGDSSARFPSTASGTRSESSLEGPRAASRLCKYFLEGLNVGRGTLQKRAKDRGGAGTSKKRHMKVGAERAAEPAVKVPGGQA